MNIKEQTDAHHVRTIRAALKLVERQRYSDALSLLQVNLGTLEVGETLSRELSRSLKVAGRWCANSENKNRRLGEYLYEVAINSAEPMELTDVYLLVKLGNKNLALRACRLIDRNQQTYRTTSLAYVYHTFGGLRESAVRKQVPMNSGKVLSSKCKEGQARSVCELAKFLYLWLYGASSEDELLDCIHHSDDGNGTYRPNASFRTEHTAQGGIDRTQELSRYCRKAAVDWTAFAKDAAEGTSENTRMAESEAREEGRTEHLLGQTENTRIARQMIHEIFSLNSLEKLKESHNELLLGNLERAATKARAMKDDACMVSQVLGLTIEAQSSGLLGTGQPKINRLETSLGKVKDVAGIASVLTLALHTALIVRLLTAGLLDRATAELSIVSFAASLSIIRMGPAISYLSEVVELSRPDRASMDSHNQMREEMLDEIIRNNLYSNLLMILREPDKEGFESIYGSGLVKPATALKNLHRLRLEGRFAEYVEYAGSVTDELLAEEYQDYDFVLDIRVNQAEVLENLGRTRHAERVATYVLTNSNRMALSNRIQSRARVVLGRTLLAEGELTRASQALYDNRPNSELSTAELYVRSLINEKSGKLIEASEDLAEVAARTLSSEEYSLLKLEPGQIERRIEAIERSVELDKRACRKVWV